MINRRFNQFLENLAKVLKFPQLRPDSKGVCLLKIQEGELFLLFEFDEEFVPNTVLLSSPILLSSKERTPLILQACLKGNALIEETLSLHPDEERIYLHRRIHPDIEQQDLDQILSRFIARVREWKSKLMELSTMELGAEYLPLPPPTFISHHFKV